MMFASFSNLSEFMTFLDANFKFLHYAGSQKHEVCQILRGSAFSTEAVFTSRNLRKPIGTCDYQFPITNYQLPITNYQLPITGHTSPLRERLYQ